MTGPTDTDGNDQRGRETSPARPRRHRLTALFPDRDSADCAFRLVTEHGYESHEVDVLMTTATRDRHFAPAPPRSPARALHGAEIGGAVGGSMGAVAAALVAASSIAFPGVGLVVAGPLAALMAGGAAGGLTGGLIGALIGWGVPADHAGWFDHGLRGGAIALRLWPHNAEDAAVISARWRALQAHLMTE